jgi:hypothetical protein
MYFSYYVTKDFIQKKSFYEKVKMTIKRIVVFQSFVIFGSCDCDHTPMLCPCQDYMPLVIQLGH